MASLSSDIYLRHYVVVEDFSVRMSDDLDFSCHGFSSIFQSHTHARTK